MLTIVLVIYKTEKKKLEYILKKIGKKYSIIIIDNSKNYNFSDLAISKKTKIIRSNNNGNGAAINKALKKCETRFAMYMDVDIEIDNNFLVKFVDILKKIREFGILVPNHGNFKNTYSEFEFYKGEASVMLYDIENLKKISFFDENFFLYYEEIDLLHRCKINNIKCFLIPYLTIKHNRASSIENEGNDLKCLRVWHYMWSMFYFYKKNLGYISAIRKTYKYFIKDFIVLLISIFVFDFKKMKLRFFRLYGLISSIIGLKSFLRP